MVEILSDLPGVVDITQPRLNEYVIANDGRDATRIQIAETVVNSGWGLLSMAGAKMNLETVFLNKMREAEFATLAMSQETLEELEDIEYEEVKEAEMDELADMVHDQLEEED